MTAVAAVRDSDGSTLVDRLAVAIQGRILSGSIPIGTRLRQEALAEEFEVSRTPVREALRKLQATGIVELLPNRGAVVRGPSARDIREAYEVRAELEGLAAELAAGLISDRDLLRLREAEALFRRSVSELVAHSRRREADPGWSDESSWVEANDLFHQAILDAAANARLSATIADLHRSFPRDLTWAALAGNSRLLEENVDQHGAILEAIDRRDPTAARRRMAEHVRSAGELVTRHFEQAAEARAALDSLTRPRMSP
jgi:DNA-binding GntR family transcriptional regulator